MKHAHSTPLHSKLWLVALCIYLSVIRHLVVCTATSPLQYLATCLIIFASLSLSAHQAPLWPQIDNQIPLVNQPPLLAVRMIKCIFAGSSSLTLCLLYVYFPKSIDWLIDFICGWWWWMGQLADRRTYIQKYLAFNDATVEHLPISASKPDASSGWN